MNKLNKYLIIFLGVMLSTFLIAMFGLLVQTLNIQSTELSTIVGGILSMVGGMIGAFGAYLVASFQIKKNLELEKERLRFFELSHNKRALKKLQLLNKFIIDFSKSFIDDLSFPPGEELYFKMEAAERSIEWIVGKINSFNENELVDALMLDFLNLSKISNLLFHEIIVFNKMPVIYKPHNIEGLHNVIKDLIRDHHNFDIYVNNQMKMIDDLLKEIDTNKFRYDL